VDGLGAVRELFHSEDSIIFARGLQLEIGDHGILVVCLVSVNVPWFELRRTSYQLGHNGRRIHYEA
jgi:hypothetical protein